MTDVDSRMGRITRATLVLAFAGWARVANAAPGDSGSVTRSVRLARPWVVQAELTMAPAVPRPLPGYACLGLSVRRALMRFLDAELTLGKGLASEVLAADAGGQQRDVSVSTGVHTRALLRGVLGLGAWDRWALSGALGPALMLGGDYGSVALLRAEAAVEFRSLGGFAVLYALGYELSLSDTGSPVSAAECVTSDCPTRFESGKGQLSPRMSLGFSF